MSVLNLSGSAGIKALIDELEKLVDDKWMDDSLADMCKPTYSLQFDKEGGSKLWLFSEAKRAFFPYPWGINIEPLEDYTEDSREVACMIGHDVVMVPPDYIVDVGWN